MMRRDVPFAALIVSSAVVAAGLLAFVLTDTRANTGRGQAITVLCAAGIQGPVIAVVQAYEREFGTHVDLTFGGSGTLLASLGVRARGDLYIAGDDSYLVTARQQNLVTEVLAAATMRPVIAVQKGNPQGIRRYRDLLRGDVRVGLGNPGAAAIGKISKRVANELGIWAELEQKTAVFKPTVNDLGNDLRLGTLDAAVIWDATARQYDDLEIVDDPVLSKHVRRVTLGVLEGSEQPTAALHFARFLTARDRGLPVFAAHGFAPIEGDAFVDVPRLRLMSGAMLRPAIDATITAFERREGVVVDRVYNGCGILVSQMKTGTSPDAYFSCDASFLAEVQDRFHAGRVVSQNDLVVLVQKGNPKNIAKLEDLAAPGLRVGLGHPENSALGALTVKLLQHAGLRERLRDSSNVVVEPPTGDLLVNDLRAGALDAALVYRSNTAHVLLHCDVVALDGQARATQPYAIALDSSHPILMQRLLDALASDASRTRFKRLGFRWREDDKPK